MQPRWIARNMVEEAIIITQEKKPELSKLRPKLRFEKYKEGKAAISCI